MAKPHVRSRAHTLQKKRFVSRSVEKSRAFVGFSRDGRELNGKNGSVVVAALVRLSLFSPTVALTKFKLQASLAAVATKRDPDFERVSGGWLEALDFVNAHETEVRCISGLNPARTPRRTHTHTHTHTASQIVTNRHYREPGAGGRGRRSAFIPGTHAHQTVEDWRRPAGWMNEIYWGNRHEENNK